MEDMKLFFGSSIVEMREERQLISALIQAINDALIDDGIFSIIDLFLCEHQSAAIGPQGSQEAINDILSQSDISIFLVNQRFGEFTKEEYERAITEYKIKSSPKVYVLVKKNEHIELRSKEAKDFILNIDQSIVKVYEYEGIEELKIIILKILDSLDGRLQCKFDGHKTQVRGKKLYV
ncbi:MAG: hypothetical protein RBQ97_03555 [Acholeplasma sp.]|jgi:hypothetical protein|nr:hypothetical protein [Acholeplasma sp.]